MEDELLNELLQDSPAEDEPLMGLAADLITEPEQEKTPEPDGNRDGSLEREGDVDNQERYNPTRGQEAQEAGG